MDWLGFLLKQGIRGGDVERKKKKLLTGRRSRQFVDLQGQILREYMRPLWGASVETMYTCYRQR